MADGLRVLAARSMIAHSLHVNFQRLCPTTVYHHMLDTWIFEILLIPWLQVPICPHQWWVTIACGFGFVKISGTWSLDLEIKLSCQVIGVGSTAFNYPFIPDMWQYAIHLPLDMLLIFCKSSLTGITFLNESLVQFFNFLFMLLSKAPPYSRLGGGINNTSSPLNFTLARCWKYPTRQPRLFIAFLSNKNCTHGQKGRSPKKNTARNIWHDSQHYS